eukprot:1160800-Pelagomonas_calceolata.AAC.10
MLLHAPDTLWDNGTAIDEQGLCLSAWCIPFLNLIMTNPFGLVQRAACILLSLRKDAIEEPASSLLLGLKDLLSSLEA